MLGVLPAGTGGYSASGAGRGDDVACEGRGASLGAGERLRLQMPRTRRDTNDFPHPSQQKKGASL